MLCERDACRAGRHQSARVEVSVFGSPRLHAACIGKVSFYGSYVAGRAKSVSVTKNGNVRISRVSTLRMRVVATEAGAVGPGIPELRRD